MEMKGHFYILLIIGIAACVTSNECPPKEVMGGCRCSETSHNTLRIVCNGEGTGKTIQDYRKIFQEKVIFRIRNIELTFYNFDAKSYIPSRMFEGYRITKLTFSGSNISKWADEEGGPAFIGLEDTLEEIVFDHMMDMDSKQAPSLSHLRKLREVLFFYNRIYTFDNNWFDKGPSSLETLNHGFCNTRSIGDRAFAGLTNLKEINMRYNEIEGLSRSMFPNPANNLEKIIVSNNKIGTLPDDMFTNMPALAEVDLSSNSITRLPENVWRPVWSRLELLDLSEELKCDASIDWIFKVTPPKELYAYCHDTGENLEELIKKIQKES